MNPAHIKNMITTIILSVVAAIGGTFSIVAGYLLFRRKHSAEAANTELTNEAKVREIYRPIIDDLRAHIEEENERCAKRLSEMSAEVDGVKDRLKAIEVNCTGGCFSPIKKVK
jgi:hypothetical protein